MSRTITSGAVTFMDVTDNRKLDVYITSNSPTVQIRNLNTTPTSYTPDWTSTPLVLEADAYLDSRDVNNKTSFSWYKQGVDGTEVEVATNTKTIMVNSNDLDTSQLIVYVCRALYKSSDADAGISAVDKMTFSQTTMGKNGADGTSVKIKGTATSVSAVSGTDYYTIVYGGSDISSAELNDAYMYNGDLYVCVNSKDGVDYFINVGRIQGPAGQDAKIIILTGSAQVFKVSKAGAYTPETISVTATPVNTSVSEWSYSVNGGKTFLSTAPSGVVRNGTVVTITGSTFASNSLVIKASDGSVSDVLTVYKAFDGTDGSHGNNGESASIAFLTNENISFSADENGKLAATSFTTNVVAYTGTTKVPPTIGTIAGLPSGMTASTPTTTANEQIITFTIAKDSTLGAATSNSGTITIPVTSPIATNLVLSWSKINTGATGVGISSTTVTYGVSDSSATQPTSWQSTLPTVADGKYLWTRTIIDYTDTAKADTVTYTYAKQGTVGATGSAGTSVTVSSIQYQAGDSATTPPTGTWSSSVVSVSEGKYLWTKTTFSDNKVAYGVAKQGLDGASGTPGVDAVTFQVYSTNGYVLSTNIPSVTLQTFAYVGDVAITAGATYQWYSYGTSGWSAISGATNAYLTISRESVTVNQSYMCKMTFNGLEYKSVATINDKGDENKLFTAKPSNYIVGDIWIVGTDYIPAGYTSGTMLKTQYTRATYEEADWIEATKYDKQLQDLQDNLDQYNQYFSFNSVDGIKITAKDSNGVESKYSTTISNDRWAINYGSEAVTYVDETKMHIKEAEIESPLSVTGKYSGSTMLQAPIINLGNFSLVIESNGSLSVVVKT